MRAAGLPVVLETLSRDVLADDAAGADPARLLAGWRERSQEVTPVIVAAGSTVESIPAARRTLSEAVHIAQAAPRAGPGRSCYRLDDVRLRGLLHLLRDDDRLTAFAERELSPLLADEAGSGGGLMQVLREFCRHGGNISAAAVAAHRSRTAFYEQLGRIEEILGVSLADPESMLSL